MSKVDIKLNSEGVRSLLKSPEMRAICNEYALRIATNAGEGYDIQERSYPSRVGTVVKPITAKARKDNSDNNTLLKAVHP